MIELKQIIVFTDNEVPKVLYCPTNIERIARQHSVRVFWQEPVFEDDVDGKAITVTQNSPNGSMFPKGVFVIIYHALDRSGNQATCQFTITIRGKPFYNANQQII